MGTGELNRETTSFDPKTWVDLKPTSAPAEESSAEPAKPGGPKPILLAAPAALVLAAGGAWFLWPVGDDTPAEVPSTEAPASAAPAPTPSPSNSVRIVQVGGVDDLGFSLEAMGIPTGDAFAKAQ